MEYSVQVTTPDLSLADLELTIQQLEGQDFTLASLAAGTVGSQRANILTLAFATASGTLTLAEVSGTLDEEGQSERLDALAGGTRHVVSLAGVWMNGHLRNVAVVRTL